MASEYSWHVVGQVIYARLFGDVLEDDLRKGNKAILKFLEEAQSPEVHLIFDFLAVEHIQVTIVQTRHELRYLQHPRLGWVVMFGTSSRVESITNFMGEIISRLVGLQIRSFPSLDETLLFLKSIDSSLPYSPVIDKTG